MLEINPKLVMTMVQIIDLAASKGIFAGKDLTTAGEVRRQLEEVLAPLNEQAEQLEAQRRAELAAANAQAEYEESVRKSKIEQSEK